MSSGLSKSPYRAMLNKDSLDTSIAIEDEHVDAPISLGLTTRQARVYLALLMMGNSKAKAIVSLSLVSRQDVYLIISSLQEMGLVQRKVSAPTTFTATPISEAVEALLERKASELRRARLKTKNLVEKFNHISLHAFTTAGTSYLGIVSESDRGKKYRFALENARHSIDVVTTWKRFKQANLLF